MESSERPRRSTTAPCAVLLLLVIAFCVSFSASGASPKITQLSHSAWRARDGDIAAGAEVVAQTKDGYLWVGTELGLFRFDGVRFTRWVPPNGQSVDSRIYALLGDPDGGLWIGTGDGLYYVVKDKVTYITSGRGIWLQRDGESGVWFTRLPKAHDPGFCHVVHLKAVCFGPPGAGKAGVSVIPDPGKGDWFVDLGGDLIHESGTESHMVVDVKQGRDLRVAARVAATGIDSAAVVSMTGVDTPPFVRTFRNGTFVDRHLPSDVDASTLINALLVDPDGSIWAGTSNRGIYHLSDAATEHFDRHDGLSGDSVSYLYRDAEGTLWVATSSGLDAFHRLAIETWSKAEGLTTDQVGGVVVDRNNKVWISNYSSLDTLDANGLHSIRSGAGLPGKKVGAVFLESSGRLWLGVDYGLWYFENGRFVQMLTNKKKPFGSVGGFVEDADHSVWVVCETIYHLQGTRIIGQYSIEDPVSVVADRNGGIWLGTGDMRVYRIREEKVSLLRGLDKKLSGSIEYMKWEGDDLWLATREAFMVWKNGGLRTLSHANGLDFTIFYSALQDLKGNLWLMTDRGYLRVSHEDIEHWLADPSTRVTPIVLGPLDGAQPGYAEFSPEAHRAPNGDLWFATDKVLQHIVPTDFLNPHPPAVMIEALIADGKTFSPAPRLVFPAGSRNLEIHFTSPTFISPKEVHFQYKLEGWDDDWQNAGNRRQAFYTNLPPRAYRFRVRACNSSGVWNQEGTSVDFRVKPSMLQQPWVQALLAVAALAVVWLLYHIRLFQARERMRERLAARLAERERIARDLHDTLLQSTQGLVLRFQSISLRMPAEDPVRRLMENVLKTAETVMEEGRERIHQLRSNIKELEQFAESIRGTIIDLQRQYSPVCFRFDISGTAFSIDAAVCEELYLITRELLTNAFKHAQASEIGLDLVFQPGHLQLVVSDNGIGTGIRTFSSAASRGHFGLVGVEERATALKATISVSQQAGKGTQIFLTLPIGTVYKSAINRLHARLRMLLTRSSPA